MKRFVLLAFALGGAAACGDNLTGNEGGDIDAATDAPQIDAAIDAPDIDAPIDAPPPPPFTGTITIIEGQVLAPAPAPAGTIAAQGIQLGMTFLETATAVQPVLDTSPTNLFGCKVTEYDSPAEIVGSAGNNEGTITWTVDNGGSPANPTYPTCVFVPGGTGYICPDPSSSQALTAVNNVTLGPAGAPPSTLTLLTVVAGTATFDAADVGRYVKFAGTGNGTLDHPTTAIPIVALGPAPNMAVLGTSAVITATANAGMLSTLAGVGPFPMLPDPGQLADGASATATLTPGGGNHFPATVVTYSNVGDDFTMDAANAGTLRNIPRDGSAFTIACDTCGTSIGTVLNITTTDGVVTGLSPFAMPPPANKRVTIRCAEVGATSITVPANVSAYIMNSGATRIQANFVRGTFGGVAPPNAGLGGVISGHAMVGFTTAP